MNRMVVLITENFVLNITHGMVLGMILIVSKEEDISADMKEVRLVISGF